MKGLFIKDYLLIKNQKLLLLIVILIGAFMLGSGMEITFIVSYVIFIMLSLALSTISYDEFENSNAYLFSLPITRTAYVREKFIFTLLLCFGSWLLSMLAIMVYRMNKNPDTDMGMFWFTGMFSLICALVFVAVAIPLWIKLGPEKGKIVYLIMGGSIAASALLSQKFLMKSENEQTFDALQGMFQEHFVLIGIGTGILALLIVGISYLISLRIVKTKEF